MANVGTVQSVTGVVKAIAEDGTERILSVGDSVAENEKIITGDGVIVIAFTDGTVLDLGSNSSIVLNDDLLNQAGEQTAQSRADAEDEVAALQQALADPNFDPTANLPATAAGTAAGGTGNNGHTIVSVDYLNPDAPVESGHETAGINAEFLQSDEELPPVIEDGPVVSVSVEVEVEIDPENPGGTPPTDGIPTGDFPVVVSGNGASVLEGTSEGTKPVVFILSLDKVFDVDVQVTYELRPLSADNPQDWFNGDPIQTVTIPAGSTTFEVTVNVVEDHVDEGNETFDIMLIGAEGATINPEADSATITIYDDDTTPVANPDTNWVQVDPISEIYEQSSDEGDSYGELSSVSGNVLNNVDHEFDPDAEVEGDEIPFQDVADTDADGDSLTVTGVVAHGDDGVLGGGDDTVGSIGSPIAGVYGILTLQADGGYVYEAGPETSELTFGEEVTDQFSYTVTDGYNDPQTTTLTITIFGGDSGVEIRDLTPAIEGGDVMVDEDDLLNGSDGSQSTTQEGTFGISAPDGVGSLVIDGVTVINIAGLTGNTVTTGLGNEIVVTGYDDLTGLVTYEYELKDNEDHGGVDDGENNIFENLVVELTDTDGDFTSDILSIQIVDDVPTAVDDEATQGDEDSDVVYNVMSNGDGTSDTEGADGATLTGATVNTGAGSVSFLSNGQVTYNPVDGETGTVIIDYTITDGDNDTADATLTINLGEDSKPTVSVTDGTVDEAALSDGSNSGSTAETDTGTFTIGTGDDSLQTLTVGGVDVTAGGVVNGEYGDLTVTNTGGVYTWSYTLSDNTTDHTTQGTSTDGIKDDFSVVVTDSDDSVSSADTLTVTVQDDVPTAVDDEATQGDEDSDVVYNVMSNGDGTSDTEGADGATLTGATVNTGAGSVSFLSNGQVTYNSVDGETGTVIIDYTITDGDNDTADATLTINLGEDSKPTVSVSNAAVDETNGKTSIDGTLDVDFGNDLAGATVELSATGATWDGTDTLNADDGSWKIVNNANGTYTFTQLLIMTHSGAEDAEIVLNIGVTATDSDNSVDNASSFTVTVYDDGPVVTDKDGVINLSAGDSLEVLAYDLGEDALGGVVFSLDSSSVPLTSGDQAILTESIDTGNGLESFVGYIDLDTDGIYDVGEEVFTITPTNSNADGTYEITLSADNVLDLPTSKVELSFTGISAGGPTESVDVGSDLTISIVDAGTTVNTSNGFIGINNNVMNDNGGGETILYTFNNGLLINDLQLDIKDVGGSGDTLTWTVYNSVDNTTESGPLTINGNGLSDPISPTIDFDSVELFVTSGDFKIGGITYTDLGDPQDVMMQFGYDATDADGDVVSGSIDVTVSASTGTNITGSDLLTHSDANIDVS